MHDVRGQIVLACADENLLTTQLVRAVGLGLGLGAQHAQIRAAMRLGQAHGAGPFAAGQLGQVQGFLLGRAVRVQALIRAMAQARVHGPSLVRRVEHFIKALVHHKWQTLPAKRWVAAQRGPSTRHILLISSLETIGGFDLVRVAVQLAALRVARNIEGKDHLGGKLATFFEHRIDGVGIRVGVLGQGFEFCVHVEQLMQNKLHVAKGRGVDGHERNP